MSDFDTSNPNLLNPMNTTQQQVTALPGITKPYEPEPLETPYYFTCTMLNHHMHRPDGKRLAFLFGTLETKDGNDVKYLQQEIAAGNPFIKASSEQEVNIYRMRVDPQGTMTQQLTPQIEQRVTEELSIKLQNAMVDRMKELGIKVTPEQMAAFTVPVEPVVSDASKLAGSTALERLKVMQAGAVPIGTGVMLQGIQGSDKTVNFAPEIGTGK